MWTRLDEPGLCEEVRRLRRPDAGRLAALLGEVQGQDWASRVAVVTSLGSFHLTSRLHWNERTPAGTVHLSGASGGGFVLGYVPPHGGNRTAKSVDVDRGSAAVVLGRLVAQLLDDHGKPFNPSARDRDPGAPELAIGDLVQVVANERNRRLWTGWISRRVWHHKEACWTYWIDAGRKRVRKRYFRDDLQPVALDEPAPSPEFDLDTAEGQVVARDWVLEHLETVQSVEVALVRQGLRGDRSNRLDGLEHRSGLPRFRTLAALVALEARGEAVSYLARDGFLWSLT